MLILMPYVTPPSGGVTKCCCFLRLSFEELAQSLVNHVNKHNSGLFQTETYTPGNHHG